MKKLFSIALLSLMAAFTACSDDSSSVEVRIPEVKFPETKVFTAEPSPEWVTKLPEAGCLLSGSGSAFFVCLLRRVLERNLAG